MDSNNEIENFKKESQNKTFASTSEASDVECERQCETRPLIIEPEESDNTGSNDVEISVSTSSADKDKPLSQNNLDMSSTPRNGFSPTNITTDDNIESTTLSSSSSSQTNSSENFLLVPSDVRLVRGTSLKSKDRPVQTQCQKKIVRFADALGLDLEDIRHFVKGRTPTIPQSAFADLEVNSSSGILASISGFNNDLDLSTAKYTFTPEFEQPGSDPQFMNKLRQQKVCLEDIIINSLRITGVVRTLNIGFEKLVQIRYTTDDWLSHNDITADYITNSSDGFSDKFAFTISLPTASPDENVIFVVKYSINGIEYWDNNYGRNFTLKCEAKKK